MQIHLIAVGEKMPRWVQEGYDEYAKRLPPECALRLVEVPAGKRGKNADVARIMRDESERLLAAIPRDAAVVALEVGGSRWSTGQLAQRLEHWLGSGQDLVLLVGGPDGLTDAARMTLPHPLVRVVLAEQIYRAWSILRNHPYHRA